MKKLFILSAVLFFPFMVLAHQPRIVEGDFVEVKNPEISQAFYDELSGTPKVYKIESDQEFNLYLNLLVPQNTNPNGRYSAEVYKIENSERILIANLNGNAVEWSVFYEPFAGDNYLKGPEFLSVEPAGKYEVDVLGSNNIGKYVLAVGNIESFSAGEILRTMSVLPRLKIYFFGVSSLTLILTPFGGAGLILILILIFGGYLAYRKFFRRKRY
jgi:hypothetical protein